MGHLSVCNGFDTESWMSLFWNLGRTSSALSKGKSIFDQDRSVRELEGLWQFSEVAKARERLEEVARKFMEKS